MYGSPDTSKYTYTIDNKIIFESKSFRTTNQSDGDGNTILSSGETKQNNGTWKKTYQQNYVNIGNQIVA
jgi:hypothetical protein